MTRRYRSPIFLDADDIRYSEWIGHMGDYEDPEAFVRAIAYEDNMQYDAKATAPYVQRRILRFTPCYDGEHRAHIERAKGERGSFWAYQINVDDLQEAQS